MLSALFMKVCRDGIDSTGFEVSGSMAPRLQL